MSALSNLLQYRVEVWKVLLSVGAIISVGILGRNFRQPLTVVSSTTETKGIPTTDESSEKKVENENTETAKKGD